MINKTNKNGKLHDIYGMATTIEVSNDANTCKPELNSSKTWKLPVAAQHLPEINIGLLNRAFCFIEACTDSLGNITQFLSAYNYLSATEEKTKHFTRSFSYAGNTWSEWDEITTASSLAEFEQIMLKSLPTDPVLHYSFDELPNLPDTKADFLRTNDWKSSDLPSWQTDTILSIDENGYLNMTATSSSAQIPFHLSEMTAKANKFIVLDIESTSTIEVIIDASSSVTIYRGSTEGVRRIVYKTGSYNYNTVLIKLLSIQNKVKLRAFYIGDADYAAPLVDNSGNGHNATINGVFSEKGICGKGCRLFPNSYINTEYRESFTDFSVSIWVKPDVINTKSGGLIAKDNFFVLRNGASWDKGLMLYIYTKKSDGSYADNYTIVLSSGLSTVWQHLVVTKKGSYADVYLNGNLIHTKQLASAETRVNNTPWTLGSSGMEKEPVVDDFQIFDRALSESEVKSLYMHHGNTPKVVNTLPKRLYNHLIAFFYNEKSSSESFIGQLNFSIINHTSTPYNTVGSLVALFEKLKGQSLLCSGTATVSAGKDSSAYAGLVMDLEISPSFSAASPLLRIGIGRIESFTSVYPSTHNIYIASELITSDIMDSVSEIN